MDRDLRRPGLRRHRRLGQPAQLRHRHARRASRATPGRRAPPTPAPCRSAGGGSRIAACWYAATSFTVDVDLTDGQKHDLELYFLDWDTSSRAEQVQISDAATGAVLSTQTISSFHDGRVPGLRGQREHPDHDHEDGRAPTPCSAACSSTRAASRRRRRQSRRSVPPPSRRARRSMAASPARRRSRSARSTSALTTPAARPPAGCHRPPAGWSASDGGDERRGGRARRRGSTLNARVDSRRMVRSPRRIAVGLRPTPLGGFPRRRCHGCRSDDPEGPGCPEAQQAEIETAAESQDRRHPGRGLRRHRRGGCAAGDGHHRRGCGRREYEGTGSLD